jgi:hypothetical protein
MDLVSFLSSVNLISLVAFVLILVFLIYEVSLLVKEQQKKSKPVIPQFDPQKQVTREAVTEIKKKVYFFSPKSPHFNKFLVILLSCMLFLLGAMMIYSLISQKKTANVNNQPQIIIEEISSPGIKIFSEEGIEIKNEDLNQFRGRKVVLGIASVGDSDIDKARLRVNTNLWLPTDVTSKFDKRNKVFYKEYEIATDEQKLKIEAQLHSAKDGWLGE